MKTGMLKSICIVFSLLFSNAVVSAQSAIGFRGAGIKLGYTSPQGDFGNTLMYEVMADLGEFSSKIKFSGRLGYWSTNGKVDTLQAGISKRDVILGGTAIVRVPIQNEKLKPYFGAGLSLNFLSTSFDESLPQETRGKGGSEMEIGLDVTFGVRYALAEKIDGVGDVMWTLGGEAEQFAIRFGFLFTISE